MKGNKGTVSDNNIRLQSRDHVFITALLLQDSLQDCNSGTGAAAAAAASSFAGDCGRPLFNLSGFVSCGVCKEKEGSPAERSV